MRFTSVFLALLCASSGADASERSKDRHSSLRNEKNHSAKDSAVGRCIDNNNFLDKFGNDCYFYDKYPNMCENSCAMNRRGETPETECCACQDFGCTDNSNFKDKDGMTCSQYDNNKSWCKDADSYANRNGVSANDACCACGGGSSGENPSDLPFAGKLYDIRGFGLNADKYLQISARNGVHMVSSDASRKHIKIEEINGKYALKEHCVYASCQVAYLTIENPYGEAYVTTTSRISADIEFRE